MKLLLNIIIEDKESGERYLAENKCSPFKFVVGQSEEKVHQKGNLKPEYYGAQ